MVTIVAIIAENMVVKNLAIWHSKCFVVILVKFKLGGLSTMAHRRLSKTD